MITNRQLYDNNKNNLMTSGSTSVFTERRALACLGDLLEPSMTFRGDVTGVVINVCLFSHVYIYFLHLFWYTVYLVGRKISFFLGNLGKDDAKHNIMDDFLRGLIEIWVDFNFRDSFLSNHVFCSSMTWNNSLVKIASRLFFYKQ